MTGTVLEYIPGTTPTVFLIGNSAGRIFRSTDGCVTWLPTFVPPTGGEVQDFVFKDSLIGWAATSTGCWRTTDGGKIWNQIVAMNRLSAVHYDSTTGKTFFSTWAPPTYPLYSSSDGLSFSQVNGVGAGNGFAESTPGTLVVTRGPNFLRSTFRSADGGKNWTATNFAVEVWQPAGSITGELLAPADHTSAVYSSRDGGQNWGRTILPVSGITGCAVFDDCGNAFLQYELGFYMRSAYDLQWRTIGGPGLDADTRFCALGGEVYALGYPSYGERTGLWKYTPPEPETPQVANLLVPLACNRFDSVISITNPYCHPMIFAGKQFTSGDCQLTLSSDTLYPFGRLSIAVSILSALPGTFTTQLVVPYIQAGVQKQQSLTLNYTVQQAPVVSFGVGNLAITNRPLCVESQDSTFVENLSCSNLDVQSVTGLPAGLQLLTALPFSLAPGEKRYVYFKYQSDVVASANAKVSVTAVAFAKIYTQAMDCSVSTIAIDQTPRFQSQQLDIRPLPLCERDSAYTFFTHNICGGLFVDSIGTPRTPGITCVIDNTVINFGDSVRLGVRLDPEVLGQFDERIDLYTHDVRGQQYTTPFSVTGAVIPEKPDLAFDREVIDFGNLVYCEEKQESIGYSNPICQAITLDAIKLSGRNPAFSLIGASSSTLQRGDASGCRIHFRPDRIGSFSDTLTVTGSGVSFKVPIIASATEPGELVSLSESEITFSELVASCENEDREVTLSNVICASVTIDSITIEGEGWSVSGFPTLGAMADEKIRIHFAPIESGEHYGVLRVFHHLMEEPLRLVESRLYASVRGPNVCPVTLNSEVAFATVVEGYISLPLTITVREQLPTDEIALTTAIEYNTDILELTGFTGLDQDVKLIDKKQTLTGCEIRMILGPTLFSKTSSSLGTLSFKAYLSNETRTSIVMKNIEATSSTECYALSEEGSAEFSVILECGDRTISDGMGSRLLSIKALYPNPAKDELHIKFTGELPAFVRYEVESALGQQVKSGLLSKEHQVSLENLAEGFYILTARTASGESLGARSFRVER